MLSLKISSISIRVLHLRTPRRTLLAGNLEALSYDLEEATSDDPVVSNLNATNFTGTFSGESGDMILSVTGSGINKLFGGSDSIGTV